MFGISHLFERIKNTYGREVVVRGAIQAGVKKFTSTEIPLDSISFSSTTVILTGVSHIIRSVIFVKKKAILQEINRSQTIRVVTDIR